MAVDIREFSIRVRGSGLRHFTTGVGMRIKIGDRFRKLFSIAI
ncbi:hypothetical protein [Caldanaerobius polysaccharolyticus]|nr:hypothetical protein [Caldanaerobius polysaccharolyticus]